MTSDGEGRLSALEQDVASLLATRAERAELVNGVTRLAQEATGLGEILRHVQEQQAKLAEVESSQADLATILVAEQVIGADVRRKTLRRVTVAAGLAAAALAAIVLGAFWLMHAYQLDQQTQRAVRASLDSARLGCARTNERAREQVRRESALARTDVPATRPVHSASAEAAKRLLVDCAKAYPYPPGVEP